MPGQDCERRLVQSPPQFVIALLLLKDLLLSVKVRGEIKGIMNVGESVNFTGSVGDRNEIF